MQRDMEPFPRDVVGRDTIIRKLRNDPAVAKKLADTFHPEGTPPQSSDARSELKVDLPVVNARVITDYARREDVGNIVVFSDGKKRVYASDGNKDQAGNPDLIVYSTEQERHLPSFQDLRGFLDSRQNNQIKYDEGEASDIAVFGTINSNLGTGASNWMGMVQETAPNIAKQRYPHLGNITIFNPNTHTNIQEQSRKTGLDMEQFARESHNLFRADVIVMNFEPARGGIALAELRMAMLASILTGHKLIVRIEKPDMTNINVVRSRAIALADIEFFSELFKDNLNINLYGQELPIGQLPEKAVEALAAMRTNGSKKETKKKVKFPLKRKPLKKQHIVLTGSSANARDIAVRLEAIDRLKKQGKTVVDTYKEGFDGSPESSMEQRTDHMKANHILELHHMLHATDHLVYSAKGSLSQFGQLTTSLLFAAYNGSKIHLLLDSDPREEYGGGTYRSHSARIFVDYALGKVLELDQRLIGLAPEMKRSMSVMTDSMDSLIDSFRHPFHKLLTRIRLRRNEKKNNFSPLEIDPDKERLVLEQTKTENLESQHGASIPENFRGKEFGYFPKRIVEETTRVTALREVIDGVTTDTKTAKKLFDLLIHNAYGRVYPIPNSAGDFIGVIDEQESGLPHSDAFKNCILLGKVRGQLAVLGGFHDVAEGESMGQTIAREAREEGHVSTITDFAFIAERSRPDRDSRFPVVSTLATGIVKASEIQAHDDVEEIFIVPLTAPDQSVNPELFHSGSGTLSVYGSNGEKRTVTHNGFRADHLQLIGDLYTFWKRNRVDGASLSETIRQTSAMTPQDWFSGYKSHPEGQDNYSTEDVDGKKLLLTPNVTFTIEKATTIFTEIGVDPSQATLLAKQFAQRAVEKDILPLFPQAAVTLDCVMVRGNNLIVHEEEDGRLALPGTFYSPEKPDITMSLVTSAQKAVFDKYGMSFDPALFLGTVGGETILGHQADSRYPRLSSVYAGTTRGDLPNERTLSDGRKVKIREVPIWADDSHTAYSNELLSGIDGRGWMYEHNREILQPLLQRAFSTLNHDNSSLTAEELLIRYQFGRS